MTENQMLLDVVTNINRLKATRMKIYGIMAHGLVPEELIYAVGGFPLRLTLSGEKDSATKGIEYLTPATCSFARSTIGHFELKNELYAKLDAIIGGNYCNGELCTTDLISDYFNITKINIVFPSTKDQFALKFMIAELNHFKEELEKFEGVKLTDDQISNAIHLYNNERKLIQEVVEMQAEKRFILTGVECLDLMYKHLLYGVEAAIKNFQDVINNLREKSSSIEGEKIIFAGNGVPIGDNIIRLIENQGFLVIKNLTWSGLDYYNSLVDENIKPIGALARYYINSENSGRMILSNDYLSKLIKIYENSNADGIIFHIIKYCSIIPALISMKLKENLREKGIPYLEIEREYGVTMAAQLQTRLQAFKEMIK